MSSLFPDVATLAALCAPSWGDDASLWTMLGAMILAGLAGGAAHCWAMCGVFVLAQTERRLAATPLDRMSECSRLKTAALPGYHLGRITGYGLLGGAAGALGGAITRLPALHWAATALLGAAAAAMAVTALQRLFPSLRFSHGDGGFGRATARLIAPAARAASRLGGFPAGLVLSLLPCGMIYAALAAAASTGRPLAGALAMASFAAGTAPALIITSWVGHMAGSRFRSVSAAIGPYVLMIGAATLGILAAQAAGQIT